MRMDSILDDEGRARPRDRDIAIRNGAGRRWLLFLACASLLGACSPAASNGTVAGDGATTQACRPVAPCPAGWFEYTDTVCSPPSLGSGPGCSSNGDGLCYKSCNTDDDCAATGFSTCGSLAFFQGSDVGRTRPACVAVPITSAPALCGDSDAATD